jgi:hypothetical protein
MYCTCLLDKDFVMCYSYINPTPRHIGVRPMYMRLTCMGPTPYVSWCRIDVEYCDIEKSFLKDFPICPLLKIITGSVGSMCVPSYI